MTRPIHDQLERPRTVLDDHASTTATAARTDSEQARRQFWSAAVAEAAGTPELDADALLEVLASAGKSPDDYRHAIARLRRLAELRDVDVDVAEAEVRRCYDAAVQAKLAIAEAEKAATAAYTAASAAHGRAKSELREVRRDAAERDRLRAEVNAEADLPAINLTGGL